MSKTNIAKPVTTVVEVDEELDEQIEEIKTFFNDPKSKAESNKLRHCVKYILAELATDEEEIQRVEKEKVALEKGPSFVEFLFGKKEAK